MNLLDRDVVVDGVRLAYRDRGSGDPIVLVHGTPSHSFEWRHVLPRLEATGRRVVTYDLVGYGRSERPVGRDTSVPAQTDLLIGLLDALGLESPDLVTHDIGGAIGQRVAVLHPSRVRRLVLIDTVSYDSWPSGTWRRIIDERLEEHQKMSADEFETMLTRQLQMTVHDPSTMTGDVLEAYLAPHRSALGRASFFEHQVRHYDSASTEEVADDLGSLGLPVLLVWGQDDQWQPVDYARRLARDVPGSRLVEVPDAGHFVMEDQPAAVAAEVLAFLDEQRPGAGPDVVGRPADPTSASTDPPVHR